MIFIDEIQSLIGLETEGDYWDFKEMWHDNKASLLHDIICMANNQVGRDAYIIIGVSDSKSADGVKIKGVPDTNRKDQQHLIDFLRDKNFAGGIRPTVYLRTLDMLDDNCKVQQVDVVIICNSSKVPYFLSKDFQDKGKIVRAGNIYTRIGDTNTAVDSIADLDKIEYLWRKHFGIDLSVNDKLLLLLDEPDDWVGDLNNDDVKYHKTYPEFQIHIDDIEDQSRFADNSIMRNIADHQLDKNFSVSEAVITYHSTVLFREYVLYLDGYRHLIPFPKTDTIYIDDILAREPSLTYVYFNMDSVLGKLFNCFAMTENNWYCEKWDLRPGVAFLVFSDSSDKTRFDDFVMEQLTTIENDYSNALEQKKYIRTIDTEEFFIGGWSKANEIKSWYLFEQYQGIHGSTLAEKLPTPCRMEGDD